MKKAVPFGMPPGRENVMTDDRRNDRESTIVRRKALVEGVSRPVVTPIQPSVVYASPSIDMLHAQYEGRETGYTYAREGHPNATLLAQKIDALEGCEGGIVTGSGMAAVTAALMGILKAGDHVIGANQLYGRSLRLMNQDLARFGIGTSLADPTDIDAMRAAIRPETRMILVEVVSNPTLRVADMAGIAALAREAGVLLAVDNTFTTPRAWRPFEHGADIVIHSITKLLAGHSDVTLGYVAARNPGLQRAIYDFAVTVGLTPVALRMLAGGAGDVHLPPALRPGGAKRDGARRPPRFAPEGGARALSRAGRSPRCGPGQGASGGADRQHGELRDQGRRGGGQPHGQGRAATALRADAW
jgi:hypothetical protein